MVSLPDDLWARPEVAELSDGAFRVFVAGWCYAHQHRTDGYLPAGALRVLGATPRVVRELALGAWEAQGDGSYRIEDYLETNSTRAEEEAFEAAQREQRRRAGQASGEARRRTAEERAVERLVQRQTNGPLNGPFNGEATARSTADERAVHENSEFRSTARSTVRSNGHGGGTQTAHADARGNSTSPSSSSPPPPPSAASASPAPDILANLSHEDREAVEIGRKAVVSAFNRGRIPCPRVLWRDIEVRLAEGWAVEEFEEAVGIAARKGGRSFEYVCEVVSTRRLEAARQRLAGGDGEDEYEYEYEEVSDVCTGDQRERPGFRADGDAGFSPDTRAGGGHRAAIGGLVPAGSARRGGGGRQTDGPWDDGEQPGPGDGDGPRRPGALGVVEREPEPERSDPFDGMTPAQREAMHEYVLGWERFALENDATLDEIRQLVQEFGPDDLRWARAESRRQRIWPPWPKLVRELLANRGVEPAAAEPGPGARDHYLASPQEWADWAEWRGDEAVWNTWRDAIRNLGEDPALALVNESVIGQARLVCGRWPEWVVAVPGSALATMERLRTMVLRALCEAGGSAEMGLRIVREREGRRA